MSVFRVIFRLDFNANYIIVDHPGLVMKTIQDAPEGFWGDLRDSQSARRMEATFKDDDRAYQFSVEPSAMYGTLEDAQGISLKGLEQTEVLVQLSKISKKVCEEFHVDELNRIGVRIFYFAQVLKDVATVKQAFRSIYDNQIIEGVNEYLGDIDDFLLSFDGIDDQKVKYHLKCGPHTANEAGKYMQELPQALQAHDALNFVCDLDLYEANIETPKIALTKWFRPHFEKAAKIIGVIEQRIAKGG